jgi:hypothetical protein
VFESTAQVLRLDAPLVTAISHRHRLDSGMNTPTVAMAQTAQGSGIAAVPERREGFPRWRSTTMSKCM